MYAPISKWIETTAFCALFKSNQIEMMARGDVVYMASYAITTTKIWKTRISVSVTPPVAANAVAVPITVIHCANSQSEKSRDFLSFNFSKLHAFVKSRSKRICYTHIHIRMQFVKNNIKCSRCFTFNTH